MKKLLLINYNVHIIIIKNIIIYNNKKFNIKNILI